MIHYIMEKSTNKNLITIAVSKENASVNVHIYNYSNFILKMKQHMPTNDLIELIKKLDDLSKLVTKTKEGANIIDYIANIVKRNNDLGYLYHYLQG